MNPYGYVHNPTGYVDPFGLAGADCDKLLKNKKTTYEGPSRHDAFRQAKRDAGIPNSQRPFEISRVDLGDGFGGSVRNANGVPVQTRQYHYRDKQGSVIVIQEHSLGHAKATPLHGAEPHFNVRPVDKISGQILDTGSVPGTHGHYNFPVGK